MFVTPAFAQAAGAAGGQSLLTSMLPLVLIFGVFYFLLIRPQQKKAKAHRDMVDAVRRGDNIVTAGGVLGKVTKVVDDTTVQVEIAEGVKIKVLKGTLSDVRSKGEPAKDGGEAKASDSGSESEGAPTVQRDDGGSLISRFFKK
jgi:preprotein translocase subunit YajC